MDVLVLGGGPAGATAAIYAARSGKAVTLVYQDSGALARAERIENFYGFPAPISGPDLFRQGLEQVRSLGVTVKEAQILSLGFGAHGLEAETTQGTLAAPAVVLATGAYSESSFARTMSGCTADTLAPSGELYAALRGSAAKLGVPLVEGVIHSSDVFYRHDDRKNPTYWELLRDEKGCVAVEMESFALFHNAAVLGKRAACLVTISDSFVSHQETTPEERQTSFTAMMKVALGAEL